MTQSTLEVESRGRSSHEERLSCRPKCEVIHRVSIGSATRGLAAASGEAQVNGYEGGEYLEEKSLRLSLKPRPVHPIARQSCLLLENNDRVPYQAVRRLGNHQFFDGCIPCLLGFEHAAVLGNRRLVLEK